MIPHRAIADAEDSLAPNPAPGTPLPSPSAAAIGGMEPPRISKKASPICLLAVLDQLPSSIEREGEVVGGGDGGGVVPGAKEAARCRGRAAA